MSRAQKEARLERVRRLKEARAVIRAAREAGAFDGMYNHQARDRAYEFIGYDSGLRVRVSPTQEVIARGVFRPSLKVQLRADSGQKK